MPEEKKSFFDKAIDALTDRDEKAAAEKAQKEALEKAAQREAEAKRAIAEAQKATAEAAAAKAAAERTAAAAKAAADQVAAEKAADMAAKAAAARAAAQQAAVKKGVVVIKSLRVRKDHTTQSEMVAGLVEGNEVTILETWTDGKDTWAKIGPDQWAAMIYNGETYIKLLS